MSADGKTLATLSGPVPKGGQKWQRVPEAVRVWDPAKGELLAEWAWEKADPDGHYQLFLGFLPGGDVWAAAASRPTSRSAAGPRGPAGWSKIGPHPAPPEAVALAPDGSRLAVGSGRGVIRLLDAATGKDLTPGGGHRDEVRTVRFTPDGKQLVTAGLDATARTWDAATGKELRVLGRLGQFPSLSPTPRSCSTSPDAAGRQGKDAWCADLPGRRHRVRAVAAPRPPDRYAQPRREDGLGALPGDKEVTVVDAVTGKSVGTVPVTGLPVGFGGGGRLAVCFDGTKFSGWDAASGKKQFAWDPKEAGLLREAPDKGGGHGDGHGRFRRR